MTPPLDDLVHACEDSSDLEYVRECMAECVAQGVDINDTNNERRMTPLIAACETHKLAIAEYLLQSGADANVHGQAGWTALHRAIQDTIHEPNTDLVKLLLAHGADVMAVNDDNETALHKAVTREKVNGELVFDRELVEMLIDAGADITATSSGGFTPLHIACRYRGVDAAEFLLRLGVDVDARDAKGRTPLHLAAIQYHVPVTPIVELLLTCGADPNALDDEGQSIVWMHTLEGNVNADVLRLLLNAGADILAANSADRPLLHKLVRNESTPHDALDMLLERGVPINSFDESGETPLHVVCSFWRQLHLHHAEYLLSRGAKDALVVENANGYLPLHCATKVVPSYLPVDNGRFLRLLLESGADLNARTRDGLSPLSLLLDQSTRYNEGQLTENHRVFYECVQLLCSQGAVWDDSCERRLTVTEQLMNKAQGEGVTNFPDEVQGEDTLCEQVKERVKAWEDATEYNPIGDPLLLLSGMRACIQHWSEERTRGGKDVELTDIPSEVYLQGQASVLSWLKDIQDSTAAQRVSRSKICVVGPSEWGKTSLVKSLTTRKPSLVHVDDRTIGIDLFSCRFQEDHEREETSDGRSQGEGTIRASEDSKDMEPKNHEVTFWNFAGQDVYHAAHTLFYSTRTLYLLCVDLQRYIDALIAAQKRSDREGEAVMRQYATLNVFKWVETILARQQDAQFVLVATKADMVTDPEQIKAVWVDLQIRLGVWREEYAISAVKGSTSDRYGSSRQDTIAKLTRAIHGQWLVVSSVNQASVDLARQMTESTVIEHKKGFVMGNKYSRVLQAILDRRGAASEANGQTEDADKSRVEKLIMPSSRLIRDLCMEIDDLEPSECVVILRTLHQLGDILWYEHRSAGALRDCVILDPLLVLDIVREVISHDLDRGTKPSEPQHDTTIPLRLEGRLTHAMLRSRPLWRHLDDELTAAFKSSLQYFQLAYPAGDREMAHDSDIIVPAYWKLNKSAAGPVGSGSTGIREVAQDQQVYLAWEYVVSSAVSQTLFDQFAVQSYSPIFDRTIAHKTITSTENGGDFVSRILVTSVDSKSEAIRIETAASDVDSAWLKLRFFVMMMEQVLEEYGGLYVMREVVEIDSEAGQETRHRVSSAVHDIETYAKIGKDFRELHVQRPWLPTGLLNWFIEKAWRHPGRLQEIQSRAFVRRMLDQSSVLSVLYKLVVRGEQGRLYPSLWTAQYDEATKMVTLQMLSDLSGVSYHAPMEISVPSQFWAKHGMAIESGLWVFSNVIPEILTLGLVQKVIDTAVPVISGTTQRAQAIHSLIDRLDLSPQGVNTTTTSTSLPPTSARALLRDLLALYDPTFDELRVGELSNLQCAVSPSGSYVWAHPHEIKAMGGDKLTPCEPDYSAVVRAKQQYERLTDKDSQLKKQVIKLTLTFEGLEGVSAWDNHKVFCSWRLVHDSQASPLAVGSTDPNGYKVSDAAATASTGALVTWRSRVFEVLGVVASVSMLRECRLEVQVKRASRLLGRVKDLGHCSQSLADVVAADADSLGPTEVEMPLEIAGGKASVSCTIAMETVSN